MKLLSISLGLCALLFAFMPTSAQSTGRTMYVRVAGSHPDAVLQSSTDFFEAEPLGTLKPNQSVQMLDERYGEYVKICCTIDGKQIEGWVKREILQAEPPEVMPRTSEDQELRSAGFVENSRLPIEAQMRRESPEMKAALERIDRFEEFLNQRLGGDKCNPSPARMEQAMRDFQTEGGLQPGSMK